MLLSAATAVAYVLAILGLTEALRRSSRPSKTPNDVFRAARRSWWLGRLFPMWAIAMVGVVACMWSFRVQHLVQVLSGSAGPLVKAALCTLFVCEGVVTVYWLAYVRYCTVENRARVSEPQTKPENAAVLVVIPARDEPFHTLRRSVQTAAQLDWPVVRVLLVDNSVTEAGHATCESLAAQYSVEHLTVANRGGKAAALNDALAVCGDTSPILAVFDADQSISPAFLSVLVPQLMADKGLAFVQSAQAYDNTADSLVSRAADQQEKLLYDAIAGGRGGLGRAPCCGTNFVMRTSSLADVGGWDETTVSEDQVTAFHMHRRGWRSRYHREILSVGMGPTDLSSYWKQQYRWAHGATRMGLLGLSERAPLGARLDTLWSASFYAMTLVLAVLGALPVLMTLTSGMPGAEHSWLALSIYPLYALTMLFPYAHMWLRGYALRDLLLVQGLLAVSVAVYARAVMAALLGRPATFTPTPRTAQAEDVRWLTLPPVWTFFGLLILGVVLVFSAMKQPSELSRWIPFVWVAVATVSVGQVFRLAAPIDRGSAPRRARPLID